MRAPSQRSSIPSHSSGFTLLELLVTVAIVTLITAIVMVRYSAFDSSILLNNQAYELALDIRETQVRAISIQASPDADDPFLSNYGLYFDTSTNDQYILFQDRLQGSGIGLYNDNGANDETLGDPLVIDPRFNLSRIYINNNESSTVDNISIVFRRPNFDARLDSEGNSDTIQSAHLVIASNRNPDAIRTVVIYSSGQISVE